MDEKGASIYHCPNCGAELVWGDERCPGCSYHPRSSGFRVAIGLLGGAVVLLLLTIGAVYTVPSIASYLLLGAFGLFPLAMVVLVLSFVVRPAVIGLVRRR